MSSRFYWLKLKRDFFKRHDIRIIESMPNGKEYILFYLKLLCESVDHDGNLRFSDQIPYSEEMLATITDTNVDTVRSAIQIFTQLGMMEIMDDGTYFMSEVNRMIGSASNTDGANRVRRYRENQKLLSVTKCNDDVTVDVTEHNESKSKSKSKNKSKNIDIKGIIDAFCGDDLEKSSALNEFVKMRKLMKKPLTERAMQMIINKLNKLSEDRDTQIAILNESVKHNWLDVYPLKRPLKEADDDLDGIL